MGRVYAYEEEGRGRRHLVALECDGCEARIKPGPDIAESGWMKSGQYDTNHMEKIGSTYYWCPDCWRER